MIKLENVYKTWENEKVRQQALSKQVAELRSQLKSAEEKLHEQKERVSNTSSSATDCHFQVNRSREKYNKISRICNGLGHRLHGANYKYDCFYSNKINHFYVLT